MTKFLEGLRKFYAEQKHLQQLRLERHDFSGQDGVKAVRTLHWSGSKLVGDLLPERLGTRKRLPC
jgi:hypothetical protein